MNTNTCNPWPTILNYIIHNGLHNYISGHVQCVLEETKASKFGTKLSHTLTTQCMCLELPGYSFNKDVTERCWNAFCTKIFFNDLKTTD